MVTGLGLSGVLSGCSLVPSLTALYVRLVRVPLGSTGPFIIKVSEPARYFGSSLGSRSNSCCSPVRPCYNSVASEILIVGPDRSCLRPFTVVSLSPSNLPASSNAAAAPFS